MIRKGIMQFDMKSDMIINYTRKNYIYLLKNHRKFLAFYHSIFNFLALDHTIIS